MSRQEPVFPAIQNKPLSAKTWSKLRNRCIIVVCAELVDERVEHNSRWNIMTVGARKGQIVVINK
jgi:hypothetical protein